MVVCLQTVKQWKKVNNGLLFDVVSWRLVSSDTSVPGFCDGCKEIFLAPIIIVLWDLLKGHALKASFLILAGLRVEEDNPCIPVNISWSQSVHYLEASLYRIVQNFNGEKHWKIDFIQKFDRENIDG